MQLLNQSWNGKESYPSGGGAKDAESSVISPERSRTTAALSHWLIAKLAERLDLDPQQINPQKEFNDYGLNSIEAVSLSGDLENFLGCRLPPTLLWDYPTIEALARYLAAETPPVPLENRSQLVAEPGRVTPIDSEAARQMLEDIDRLSDAEVDALLDRLLSEEEGQG
jgi:acyl carrier protein